MALITAALVSCVASADDRRPEERIYVPVDPELHRPHLARSAPPFSLAVEEYAPANTSISLNLPTHIFFGSGYEIISEVVHDRFTYRPEETLGEWIVSTIAVNGPHAVTYHLNNSRFYAADTENHRVISFSHPEDEEIESAYSVAGVDLARPHDVAFDPVSGFLYVLNPDRPSLLRMTRFGEQEGALDLSGLAKYSRGLTVVENTVYVASSSWGQVIEIVDFDTGEVMIHPSFGKLVNTSAGTWDTTGFIINDIEFYDGYWYVSNFFSPYYANGSDPNLFKLVRFRTWDDLAKGRWEELSHLIGDGQVPYFFTLHQGSLYLAAFHGLDVHDAIYKISSGIFFDDFESGDLAAWD